MRLWKKVKIYIEKNNPCLLTYIAGKEKNKQTTSRKGKNHDRKRTYRANNK